MTITLIEVAPRDGFQPIGPFIPTEAKIAFVEAAHAAGLHRIEIGAFVNPAAVPQMSDTAEVLRHTAALPGLDAQVLVPNARGVDLALAAGARHLVYVISVSEAHNRSNVRRAVDESIRDYTAAIAGLSDGVTVRLNLATSFDCPFEGRVGERLVLQRLGQILAVRENVEVGLCDTTGRADPAHVTGLATTCLRQFGPATSWVFHGHDTYGLGLANITAAYRAGITGFDTAFAGLGGCPFAPGATGNTATEDAVWMFERMGIATGVDLPALLAVAVNAAALPGASAGGRVRTALAH